MFLLFDIKTLSLVNLLIASLFFFLGRSDCFHGFPNPFKHAVPKGEQ